MSEIEEEVTAGEIISGIMGIISVLTFLVIIVYLIFFTVDSNSCRHRWDVQGFFAKLDEAGNCLVQVRDDFYVLEDKVDLACRDDRINPENIKFGDIK